MSVERYNSFMRLRLKEIRKAKGLTQREVADMAGMSVSYCTEIELGRKQINANRMDKIARALAVTPQELIFDSAVEEDRRLLAELESLPAEKKQLVADLIRSLSEK